MSSLQAQLAALNGSAGKHPGSTFAASKRHEDALGRGIHWSVQKGHAVIGDSTKFKASVIYASAREASDVPFYVIEENCKHAFQQLANVHTPIWSLSNQICGKEPASEKSIKNLLIVISSLLGENDDEVEESCLHVLEYMIRRYDLHVRLMEDFCWTVLPQADRLKALVHRVLQLVDLASNQSYLWLRPYADPKQAATLPRQLIAKHVMKHADLVRQVCRLATATAQLHAEEESNSSAPRRGISYTLSFTAAVLVEGLAWLARTSDVDKEGVVRAMLPSILNACSNTIECEDWKGWGYVIASAMAETMELSPSAIAAIVGKIVNGVRNESLDVQADGIAAALSVLMPPLQQMHLKEEHGFLPLLNGKWLGCHIPCLKVFSNFPDLFQVLGFLYSERQLVIAPFLAGLISVGMLSEQDAWKDVVVLTSREKQILPIFHDPRTDLVASIAAWLVGNHEKLAAQEVKVSLHALHEIDAMACERGIAASKVEMSRVKDFLEGILPVDGDSMPPPRVAMENAQSSIRLNAIHTLADSVKESESLFDLFLTRWSKEKNETVALALIKVLSFYDKNKRSAWISTENPDSVIQKSLSGIYFWTEQKNAKLSETLLDILKNCCGLAARLIRVFRSKTDLCQYLLEFLVAHLESCDDVEKHLDYALNIPEAKDHLYAIHSFCERLTGSVHLRSGSEISETNVRSQCAWVILGMWESQLARQSNNTELAHSTFQLSMSMFCRGSVFTSEQEATLKKSLLSSVKHWPESNSDITEALISLASINIGSTELVRDAMHLLALRVRSADGAQMSTSAVLLECALRNATSDRAALVLVEQAAELISSQVDKSPWYGLIPSLTLLEHDSVDLQKAASRLISQVSDALARNCPSQFNPLKDFCNKVLTKHANSSKISKRPLASLLLETLHGSNDSSPAILLNLCVCTGLSCSDVSNKLDGNFEGNKWLDTAAGLGGCRAATIFLNAASLVGENTFPLYSRWNLAGKHLLSDILETRPEPNPVHHTLLECILGMLKGVVVADPAVVISTANAQRMRSYSVGRAEGIQMAEKYPDSMLEAIEMILDTNKNGNEILALMAKTVLASPSWKGGVFRTLPSAQKKKIASSLLRCASSDDGRELGELTSMLPFDANDVFEMFQCIADQPDTVGAMATLADYIRLDPAQFSHSNDLGKLVQVIFDRLLNVAKSDEIDSDSKGFLCQSLLSTIHSLLKDGELGIRGPDEPYGEWLSFLCALITNEPCGSGTHDMAISYQTRVLILKLVGMLCLKVTPVRAAELVISIVVSASQWSPNEREMTFETLIPVYFRVAPASNLSLLDLFQPYITFCLENDDLTMSVLYSLGTCVLNCSTSQSLSIGDHALGTLVATALATGCTSPVKDDVNNLMPRLVNALPRSSQLPTLVVVLEYLTRTLASDMDSLTEFSSKFGEGGFPMIPSHLQILEVLSLKSTDFSKQEFWQYTSSILHVLRASFGLQNIHHEIFRSRDQSLAAVLRLWQGLLLAQTSLRSVKLVQDDVVALQLMNESKLAVDKCCELMQSAMPAPAFLAATLSLLSNGTTDMKIEALRLLAERALSMQTEAMEAKLLLDIVPSLLEVIGTKPLSAADGRLVQLSGLLALEHIFRVLKSDSSQEFSTQCCTSSLTQLLDILHYCLETEGSAQIEEPIQQLLSGTALCTASLIGASGATTIPRLPKLMNYMTRTLEAANKIAKETGHVASVGLLQDAALRAIKAVVRSFPQFVYRSIDTLLTTSALLSPVLRDSKESGIALLVEKVDTDLATCVAPRLLIPLLTSRLKSADHWSQGRILLQIMKTSVDRAVSSDIVALQQMIMQSIFLSLEMESSMENYPDIVEVAMEVFNVMVMKVSEVQLRRLFVSLRDWRGEIDQTNPWSYSRKRFAFWTISAALARQLRSIFLPCLGLCVDDVISELDGAVMFLCAKNSSLKTSNGKKKLRLSEASDVPPESLYTIFPLLNCLEHALKSDAREGGTWIRTDDNKRYEAILEPLGKLLLARPPQQVQQFPSIQDTYSFLMEGDDLSSSGVIACLTALAAAAGDEQLWKPLNHAVLEACALAGRVEVRKTGLSCLLALMKLLGEEYMVLLPECLPVLSELLEDESEEIAGLAKAIIALAEELLGESLEDSLR